MKKCILFLAVFLILHISGFAQNNIQFNINHRLGDVNFVTQTAAKNNLDHDFKVTRLEYYISEISITHDGDTETTIEDLWILVDAARPKQIDLGDRDINTIEKISFHIGVDSAHNHLDPSTYPSIHPLSPKSPSMHWGWTPGYRFVALEGTGGSAFNQTIELHGVGDNNYFKIEIDLDLTADNNEIIINLDADYTRALENISVNSGVFDHGPTADAKQCLENFRDFVFSATNVTTSTIEFKEVNNFSVFPNPASAGNFTIALDASEALIYQVSITDMLGKQMYHFSEVNSNTTMDVQLKEPGFYFINLIKEGYPVITRKLISK